MAIQNFQNKKKCYILFNTVQLIWKPNNQYIIFEIIFWKYLDRIHEILWRRFPNLDRPNHDIQEGDNKRPSAQVARRHSHAQTDLCHRLAHSIFTVRSHSRLDSIHLQSIHPFILIDIFILHLIINDTFSSSRLLFIIWSF